MSGKRAKALHRVALSIGIAPSQKIKHGGTIEWEDDSVKSIYRKLKKNWSRRK